MIDGTDEFQTMFRATAYNGIQPPATCGTEEVACVGEDNSYGVFVGGKLHIKEAEDLEGRVYVGGGLQVDVPVDVEVPIDVVLPVEVDETIPEIAELEEENAEAEEDVDDSGD